MANNSNDSIPYRQMDLQREINSYKVDIDFSVFKKTKEEKLKLKIAKSQHKDSLKK